MHATDKMNSTECMKKQKLKITILSRRLHQFHTRILNFIIRHQYHRRSNIHKDLLNESRFIFFLVADMRNFARLSFRSQIIDDGETYCRDLNFELHITTFFISR